VLAEGLRSVARALDPQERREPPQPGAAIGGLNLDGAPEHWVRRVQAAGGGGSSVGGRVRMNPAGGHDTSPQSRPQNIGRAAPDASRQSPPIPAQSSQAASSAEAGADAPRNGAPVGKRPDGRGHVDLEPTVVDGARPGRLLVGARRDSPSAQSSQSSQPSKQVATPGREGRRRDVIEQSAAVENRHVTEHSPAAAAVPAASATVIHDRSAAVRMSARMDAPQVAATGVADENSDMRSVPRGSPPVVPQERERRLGLRRGSKASVAQAVRGVVTSTQHRVATEGVPRPPTRAWPPAEAILPDPAVASPWPTLPPTAVAASAAGADVVRGLARADRLDHEQRAV